MAKNTQEKAPTIEAVVEAPTITHNYDELIKEYKTKSAVIRLLTAEGHSRSLIAKFMNIRYQHVRNVQVQDAIKAEAK